MDLKTKKITVMGLAKTGVACARFLASRGAQVTATDLRDQQALAGVMRELADTGIRFVVEHHDAADFLNADLVVVSPGVPQEHPLLMAAKAKGVKIVSEVELASHFISAPLVAITGTNGKTTTTTLAGELFKASGFATYIGGNIGDPLIDLPTSGNAVDVVVAEISSFQLEWITAFRPTVAALLNLSEDHLDRYASYQDYINAKLRIFENQIASDFAVVNRDDELVWQAARSLRAQLFPFSRSQALEEGIFFWGVRSFTAIRDRSCAFRWLVSSCRVSIIWKTSWRHWRAGCCWDAIRPKARRCWNDSARCTIEWSLCVR